MKASTQKEKKKSKCVKSSAEKEGLDMDNSGLRLQWVNFIDAYIKNGGNGTHAYMQVYGVQDEKVAGVNAARLLGNARVRDELNNKLTQQTITDSAVYCELWAIARNRTSKSVYAAVKALEILARMKGLLTDTKKFEFTAENPAYVAPIVCDCKKDEFLKRTNAILERNIKLGKGPIID